MDRVKEEILSCHRRRKLDYPTIFQTSFKNLTVLSAFDMKNVICCVFETTFQNREEWNFFFFFGISFFVFEIDVFVGIGKVMT